MIRVSPSGLDSVPSDHYVAGLVHLPNVADPWMR
jgi:hypothetical protein